MIVATTFAGKRVAVFGLGASGTATVRSLVAGGADVAAWDDGAASRTAAMAQGIALADLTTADWSSFDTLVLAPGVPLTHPAPHWTVTRAAAAGVEVIGDIEIFCRERQAHAPGSPFVAITGTNGKSTTTALIAHIAARCGLDAQMGGNIGRAVLTLEPPFASDHRRVHVIEMSSFQIDLTPSLAPSIGLLLNISPDHLDRHGPADDPALAMRNYAAIKERLAVRAAHAIIGIEDGLPHDDDICEPIFHALGRDGKTAAAFTRRRAQLAGMVFAEGGRLCRFVTTPQASGTTTGDMETLATLDGISTLRGAHNAENAAAAFLACEHLGLRRADIAAALASYPGLPHRMEEVGRAGRVLFINDSKATNADSTEKALSSWTGDIYWILGGKQKEGGIASLAQYFPRIAKAYLIGEATEPFAATLGGRVAFERCGTLDAALSRAAADAARSTGTEPVVLLSPACASYDQFKGFDQRGDVFRDLVRRLPGVKAGP